MSEGIDVNMVHAELQQVKQMLVSQNETFTARAKLDDARSEKLDCRLDGFEERLDAHGKRTTILETNTAAFFGEQGAFRLLLKKMDENGSKLDLNASKMEDFKGEVSTFNIRILMAVSAGALSVIGAVIVWLVESHK